MLKTVGTLGCAGLLLAACTVVAVPVPGTPVPSGGLSTSLPPNFGSRNINAGFLPDPLAFSVISGGTVSGSGAFGCSGYFSAAPDFVVNYSAGGLPLTISAISNADTTLIVRSPFQTHCSDDARGSLNPSVTINNPPSGSYYIWVGTYGSPSTHPATLTISELGR